MRDSKGIFVALVSHDGVFCKRFIDSASSWEAFGLKLVLNTRDPKSPTDPHWSWLLGTEKSRPAFSSKMCSMELGSTGAVVPSDGRVLWAPGRHWSSSQC